MTEIIFFFFEEVDCNPLGPSYNIRWLNLRRNIGKDLRVFYIFIHYFVIQQTFILRGSVACSAFPLGGDELYFFPEKPRNY